MNISDLVGIGKLGSCDARGFYRVLVKPEYMSDFMETDDVYLIFNSDRVFYVTISERELSDRKIWIRFAEDGIDTERCLHKEVILAIPAAGDDEGDEEMDELIGYEVFIKGLRVGTIADYFFNNAQYVIEIDTGLEVTVMLPYVDYYIEGAEHGSRKLYIRNADSILESNGLGLTEKGLEPVN